MPDTGRPEPAITEATIPHFLRGVRLKHDRVRDQWFIQAPEKAFHVDPIAVEILRRVDGEHTLSTIIDGLTEQFEAPRAIIAQDVLVLVSDLVARQVLSCPA